ncbi:unnamed protein product [Orchesella dallaii]|uniref:Odorant receptor n=1 Tax=Orchesella dallaii TaxID=48710 RepID=A0ABP1RQ78_9HEXA
MSTPLTIQVFQLNEFLWTKHPYPKLFFRWNPLTNKFDPFSGSYSPVLFGLFTFFPLFFLVILNTFLTITFILQPELTSILDRFVTLEIFSLNLFCFVSIVYAFRNRVGLAIYINSLLSICSNSNGLNQETTNIGPETKFKSFIRNIFEEIRKIKTGEKCDSTGVIANIMSLYFGFIPPVLTACGIIMCWVAEVNVDPLYLVFRYFSDSSDDYDSFFKGCIRIVFSHLCIQEGGRTLCFVLTYIIAACECTESTLEKIHHISTTDRIQAVKEYNTFYILHLAGSAEIGPLPFATLLVGYAVLMLSASATIMGYELLPPQIYWYAPVLTMVCLAVMLVGLPYSTGCYALSEDMLKSWKRVNEKKWFRKRLRAMRPVCFYFGGFRELNIEFMMIYLESVFETTMSLTVLFNAETNLTHLLV